MRRIGRRRLLAGVVAGIAATGLARWAGAAMADERGAAPDLGPEGYALGRLTARPGEPVDRGPTGLQPIGLGGERDGLLYVPAGYSPDAPAPLVLMLHGAGSNAASGIRPLEKLAEENGLILLAVDSRRKTWDVILGEYGPDVAFIDQALAMVFARYAVDPGRVAVEGFSDGASYALSLGVMNGDLFTHVLAFSPGFVVASGAVGAPRMFVSHGTQDNVLSIDACSRRIVPKLKLAGYDVRYQEFEGGHTYPPEIVRDALGWFAPA